MAGSPIYGNFILIDCVISLPRFTSMGISLCRMQEACQRPCIVSRIIQPRWKKTDLKISFFHSYSIVRVLFSFKPSLVPRFPSDTGDKKLNHLMSDSRSKKRAEGPFHSRFKSVLSTVAVGGTKNRRHVQLLVSHMTFDY